MKESIAGVPGDRPDGPDEPTSKVRPTEARPVVWIVEESPADAETAVTALDAEHEVVALRGYEALLDRLATGRGPDVLVLGAALPDLSGFEACRLTRCIRCELELPILLRTGAAEDIPAALAAGANDAVTRPYAAAELGARVARLASTRRLHARAVEAERARAEEASQIKDEFLATVSHELRTPLTAILGWARMLLGTSLPAAQREQALETIERNARVQTRLIEDLLDVSRGVSGKLRIESAAVDLPMIIETALGAIQPAANAKEIGVRVELDFGIEPVLGDADRLRQVVHNLLCNAVKFTPRGGSVLARLERDGADARITIADSGQGIGADFLPHVFDRFRQADGSITRAHGGLGIGLSIAQRLVELHGGTIEARSEGEGKGATFVVRLPLAPARAERAAPRPAARGPLGRLDGVRVLIVHDEADTRCLVASALEVCHAEVETAASAAEALACFRRRPPDVLLSDLGIADGDGEALIRAVRALPAAHGGGVPAAALTSYPHTEDRVRAERAGFDLHVTKPIDPGELIHAVTRLSGRI